MNDFVEMIQIFIFDIIICLMRRLSFFLFFCLITIIYSCQKDSLSGTPYHSTYYKSGIITTATVRLFTSKGEITDRLLVDRFNGVDSSIFNYWADYIANEQGFMDSIIFTDDQNAFVVEYYNRVSCNVIYQKGSFILTQSGISTAYSYEDIFTNTISYFIGQIKPDVLTEYLVSSTRGNYQFGYTAGFKYVLERKGEKIFAPLIQFLTHHDLLNQGSSGYVNNMLQEDFYKKLIVGDTVALRQYRVLYTKK
jgi:hypothetical protein